MEEDIQQPRSIEELQPKMKLNGTVTDTQLYGALVDIGVGQTGLVHISQLSTSRVQRVTDVVNPGDSVTVWVTSVDLERNRIGLSLVEPADVDWRDMKEGKDYTGTVTRLEEYGAFVDIGAERPGLLHVREMSSGYVQHPSEVVKVGEEVDVRILKLDRRRKRIDLTMADALQDYEDEEEENPEPVPTAMEFALQRAQKQGKGSPSRGKQKPQIDLSEREAILARTLKEHSQQ